MAFSIRFWSVIHIALFFISFEIFLSQFYFVKYRVEIYVLKHDRCATNSANRFLIGNCEMGIKTELPTYQLNEINDV